MMESGSGRAIAANGAAAAAALSAGAAVVATRIAVVETDPATLGLYRYVIGAACMAPFLPALWPRSGLNAVEIAKIAALGALFFGFFPWAFNAALQYTTAARGAIGLATVPMQTLVIAVLAGRERLTPAKLVGSLLAFGGVAVVFGPAALAPGGGAQLLGDGLMLLGAFSAAVYSVFGRPTLGRHGPLFVTALGMVFGALALAPFAYAAGGLDGLPAFTGAGWVSVLFLGTMGAAVQFSLFMWALSRLQPSRTAIYLTLNPLTAMVLANAVLGDAVTATMLGGFALVLAGVAAANLPASREPAPT